MTDRFVDVSLDRRGVRCTAKLLDDRAPVTCEAVWQALPLSGDVYHAKYARDEIYALVPPFAAQEPPLENPTVTPVPGDLCYFSFSGTQLGTASHGYGPRPALRAEASDPAPVQRVRRAAPGRPGGARPPAATRPAIRPRPSRTARSRRAAGAGQVLGHGDDQARHVFGDGQVEGPAGVGHHRAGRDEFGEPGARRVALVTPYTESVTSSLGEYLAEAGIAVTGRAFLGLTRHIWKVPYRDVVDMARQAVVGAADCLFISCANLPAYDVIPQLEAGLRMPVLSANQVTMWSAPRRIGERAVGPYQQLLTDGTAQVPEPAPAPATGQPRQQRQEGWS
ncbi:DUF3830 family protein [Streptomyces altiplanensis]